MSEHCHLEESDCTSLSKINELEVGRTVSSEFAKEIEHCENTSDTGDFENANAQEKNNTDGTNIGTPNEKKYSVENVHDCLSSTDSDKSTDENKFRAGRVKYGYVGEKNQYGSAGDATALSSVIRVGPGKAKAKALSAGYKAEAGRNTGAFIRGHLVQVEGSVGPISTGLGVGFDTGARAGKDGLEFKLAGTGMMIDKKQGVSISMLGSTLKYNPFR